MTNLGADPNGNASRNCWTIHKLVGCFATLKDPKANRIGQRDFLKSFVADHCTKAYTPPKSPNGRVGGSAMNYQTYAWQNAYMAAVCETDNGLMMIRIYEALAAIEQRQLTPVEPGSDEERALEAAETGLRSLITERAGESA
jgi:hypothetical protein